MRRESCWYVYGESVRLSGRQTFDEFAHPGAAPIWITYIILLMPVSLSPPTTPLTQLHYVQTMGLKNVLDLLEQGHNRQLVIMATGVGKTLLSVHLSTRFARTLFLVHFEELLSQAIEAFAENLPGLEVGQIWKKRNDLHTSVTVGMIPSLARRLEHIPPQHFDLVVVDEAHHARSHTWEQVIRHFRPQLLLGLSATPNRADGRSLLSLFDTLAFSYRLAQAVREGFLVPPKILEVSTNQPLRIKRHGEDYDNHQLNQAVDTPERNRLIIETVAEHALDRKGVVYASGVAHAEHLAAMFRSVGISAQSVHGEDPQRKEKLLSHQRGEFQILTNAMLLVESYDDPSINLGVMARPTASPTLYEQALGRPARLLRKGQTWNGKPKDDYLWIDLMDVGLDDRCRVWEFFGVHEIYHDDRRAPRVRTLSQPPTRREAIEAAHAELPAAYQHNIPLERYLTWAERLTDPPPFRLEEELERLWRKQPATEVQLRLLEAHGYDTVQTAWSKGDASEVIGNLEPSPKQKARLLALGYNTLTRRWTRNQATVAFQESEEQGRKPDWNRVRGLAPHWLA